MIKLYIVNADIDSEVTLEYNLKYCIFYLGRPGKSPERSHISSEPYEPISPPQVPAVHEKQDSMLLLSQRGVEPAEQRWVRGRLRLRLSLSHCLFPLCVVFLYQTRKNI